MSAVLSRAPSFPTCPKEPDTERGVSCSARQTGLRKGELFRLQWLDVDLDQEIILVKNTKSNKRYVPLNPTAVAILKAVPRKEDSVHVFVDPSSKEALKNIERAWRKALKAAKITQFRFHDLRHTFASRLVQQGVHLKAVQELLGHRQSSTTDRYAHLGPTDIREAVAKLKGPKAPDDQKTPEPKPAVDPVVPKPEPEEQATRQQDKKDEPEA